MFRGDGEATRKLSAAWLIDARGWKGHRDGDAGVSPGHAMVLVNHGEATGAQLLALARRITESVHERFGVMSEPERRIIDRKRVVEGKRVYGRVDHGGRSINKQQKQED